MVGGGLWWPPDYLGAPGQKILKKIICLGFIPTLIYKMVLGNFKAIFTPSQIFWENLSDFG